MSDYGKFIVDDVRVIWIRSCDWERTYRTHQKLRCPPQDRRCEADTDKAGQPDKPQRGIGRI